AGGGERVLALPPRDAKAALARQLVRRLHGEEAAAAAEADFDRTVRHHEIDDADVPAVQVAAGATVAELLVAAGVTPSLSRARRLAEQGGLSIDGQKVAHDRSVRDGEVVRAGKRRFVRAAVR
ncbi:MAG: tyrosine--tRNA ligase, partial [Candidatus Dormiibacterota bacterium]